jgi:hypothetical protein
MIHGKRTLLSPRFMASMTTMALLGGSPQGCSLEHDDANGVELADRSPDPRGIPVGFGGDALMVHLSEDAPPQVEHVSTLLPVMSFFGTSADASSIAYSTLAGAPTDDRSQRRDLDHAAAKRMTLDELVPTGELVVETRGQLLPIATPGRFVVSAAWSPTEPGYLAYSYAQEGGYGVAVIDVATGELVAESNGDYVADHITWSTDGEGLFFHEVEHLAASGSAEIVHDEGDDPVRVRPVYFDLDEVDARPTSLHDTRAIFQPSEVAATDVEGAPFAIRLSSDVVLRGEHLLGPSRVWLGDERQPIEVERIVGWNELGFVHVDYEDDVIALRVAQVGNGEIQDLALPPAAVVVSYYLPFAFGTSVTVTQVGESVAGGGCNVGSHTAGSSMAYAFDLQVSIGADDVVASAAGTVAGYLKTGSSNCLDVAGCGLYNGACSCGVACSGYGWGNYVILAHADGTYTKATHLQTGTVTPTALGNSVAKGCKLGNEGGTGASNGDKNGCGDHVHFQRQINSNRSGTSTAVSFTGAAIGSGSCLASFPATTGGMSCMI